MTPSTCLAFRVPWSDVEIVAFIGRNDAAGIAYHPRILDSTIPWSSECPHCMREKLTKLGPNARQAVKVARSIRRRGDYRFTLSPHYLTHGILDESGWTVRVIRQDIIRQNKNLVLDVIQPANQPPVFNGPMREFRSTAVDRGLKLILSGRVPPDKEVRACVRGLLEARPPIPETPCWKWAKELLRSTNSAST